MVTQEKYAVFVQVIFPAKFKITGRRSTKIFVFFCLVEIFNKRLELCMYCAELMFVD